MRINVRLSCLAAVLLAPAVSLASVYPPETGTDRESAEYLEATEAYLKTLDLEDPSLVFRMSCQSSV